MAEYDAQSLEVLKNRKAVRIRPTMYVGSVHEEGVLNCVREIVDNAVDECLAGHADKVRLSVDPAKGTIGVFDNGRGIPADVNRKHGMSGIRIAAEELHGGGKFGKGAYSLSGGLNGVGLSVVNHLSASMRIEVLRDKRRHVYAWERGELDGKPEVKSARTAADRSHTRVEFSLDPLIFRAELVPPVEELERMMFERACLLDGVEVSLEVAGRETRVWRHKDGMAAWLADAAGGAKELLHPPVRLEIGRDGWRAAAAWSHARDPEAQAEGMFCNAIRNPDGGVHQSGFRRGLARGFARFRDGAGAAVGRKRDAAVKVSGEDVLMGCVAMVSVWHREPEFVGNKKAGLGNRELISPISDAVAEKSLEFLEENRKGVAKTILNRAAAAARGRAAARRTREMARIMDGETAGLGAATKLAACESRDPRERELIIVEGDSAGGSARNARDARFQAVFPLRGKMLNTNNRTMSKCLENREIRDLVGVLGCGAGKTFDPDGLAYHTIIVSPDADSDGQHIGSLVATLFLRHFPELIRRGHLHYALPPLYVANDKGRTRHCRDDGDLRKLRAERAAGRDGIVLRRGDENVRLSGGGLVEFVDECRGWAAELVEFESATGLPGDMFGDIANAAEIHGRDGMLETLMDGARLLGASGMVRLSGRGEVWVVPLDETVDRAASLQKRLVRAVGRFGAPPEGSWREFCLEVARKADAGLEVTYLKGLGEMDPGEFRETTIGVGTRRLARVRMEDAERAADACDMLMGSAASRSEERRALLDGPAGSGPPPGTGM